MAGDKAHRYAIEHREPRTLLWTGNDRLMATKASDILAHFFGGTYWVHDHCTGRVVHVACRRPSTV